MINKTITIETQLMATPETVWGFLTNPSLLAEWLMPNNITPEKGREFQFKTKSRVKLGFEGSITCQILKLKQHSEISYTWQGILSREQHKLETTVTWTLQTQSTNQTILKLKQDGFIGFKNLIPYAVLLKTWQRLLSQKLPIAIAKYQAEI
ncbi:hypothetical protein GOQ04_21975 [Emticicia sp. ODNR4P]|jgi:uncharacterized protein YndB with AHSA1/START domain|nr:hypothetical protein [Emticicia sp. ODNR4P]